MQLLTVKVFYNAIEAHLWKAKLESEGIMCFLFDENTVSTHPFYAQAIGGIKLVIRAEDVEKVKMVLLSTGDEAIRLCPYCLSIEATPYRPTDRWKALGLAMLEGVLGRNYYECQTCKKVFW